jgi:hypothetical protein
MTRPTQKRALVFAARRLPTEETMVSCLRAFSDAVGTPATLAVTNDVLQALRVERPSEVDGLARVFREGKLRAAYLPAHDSDPSLLSAEELVDEIRLNENALHQIVGAPAPERRVVVLPSVVDDEAVAALEAHGVDALVLPKAPDEPCRVGERLVLLSGVDLIELDGMEAGDLARLAFAERKRMNLYSLDELQYDITPPWLPRIEPGAPERAERRGAPIAAVWGWLADALGFARAPRLAPTALFDQDYRMERLPPRVSVPLLLRRARARLGLSLEAARRMLDILCVEVELDARPQPSAPLPAWAEAALPDGHTYQALMQNDWRGRDRWIALYRSVRQGELTESCMMRSMAIL